MKSEEKTRKKCLIISPRGTHPPTEGNAQRILQLAMHLRERGMTVHLALLPCGLFSIGDLKQIRAFWGRRLHRFHPFGKITLERILLPFAKRIAKHTGLIPASIFSNRIPGADEYFMDTWSIKLMLLRFFVRFDIVICEYVFTSRALLCFGDETKKIIDTHDIFHDRNKSLKKTTGMETNWMDITKDSEASALDRADLIIGIQEEESRKLRTMTSVAVETVSHFIETRPSQKRPDPTDRIVLFVGSENMVNAHGVRWFLSQVWGRIQARQQNVRFRIVGKIASVIAADESVPEGVEFIGPVNDLSVEYKLADVVVNPVHFGTGVAIKTIEALAHGKALVSTTIGARGMELYETEFETLPVRIADTPEDFSENIISVLEYGDQRRQLEEAAIRFVENWNARQDKTLLAIVQTPLNPAAVRGKE